jgi:4'-phosphopantetheinyl transferase
MRPARDPSAPSRSREKLPVIFLAQPHLATADAARSLYDRLLSEEERAAADRFLQPGHRHDYIIARSLVRLGLSSSFPVAPREWRFRRDQHGKPFVAAPGDLPPFEFSLSHTRERVALLVTDGSPCGIDVEQIERANDLQLVAEKICAPLETAWLSGLPAQEWREAFFQLWTLKEAFAKAKGLGLALPWKSVAFSVGSTGVTAEFAPDLSDETGQWQFSSQKITPNHIMAVVIRAEAAQSASHIPVESVWISTEDDTPRLEMK